MAKSSSWNWDKVSGPGWSQPAEDVYYLARRGDEAGLHEVLDLGCGIGRHALYLASQGFVVTGLDTSKSGLSRLMLAARERKVAIQAVRADLTDLPFVGQSFDAVLAFHSIYHVDSAGIAQAIAELRRVLRPNGEVFVTFNSKSNPTYRDSRNKKIDEHVRMKREVDGTLLPHYYCDRADVLRLLRTFEIIQLKQVEDIYAGRTSWHYFALAGIHPIDASDLNARR